MVKNDEANCSVDRKKDELQRQNERDHVEKVKRQYEDKLKRFKEYLPAGVKKPHNHVI